MSECVSQNNRLRGAARDSFFLAEAFHKTANESFFQLTHFGFINTHKLNYLRRKRFFHNVCIEMLQKIVLLHLCIYENEKERKNQ